MSLKEDRIQKILLYLVDKRNYVTADELANFLDVSSKTVYRIIREINLAYKKQPLIQSRKGEGYKINYDLYIAQNPTKNKVDYLSPKDRRNYVVRELLSSSPKEISIYELYEQFYVSESSVSKDVETIENELNGYNLKLERKNRSLAITGEEADVRKAIAVSFQKLNFEELSNLKDLEGYNFNKYDVLFVLNQIRFMEKELGSEIPTPYDTNIFSHMYILISRARKMRFSKKEVAEELSIDEKNQLDQDKDIYKVAKSVIEAIETYMNMDFPNNEIYYLYQYMVSSRMNHSVSITTKFSTRVVTLTNFYLEEMEKRLNISTSSETIFTDLGNHIQPMLNRLEHKIHVHNSLKEEIKQSYPDIFTHVKKVSELVSENFDIAEIDDHEIGFITLYFARIRETNQIPIKTIIMCTTGIGTSELLKVKIEKAFSDLEILSVISMREFDDINQKYPEVDLLISTINVKENNDIETLLISSMLNSEDKARLRNKIGEIYDKR